MQAVIAGIADVGKFAGVEGVRIREVREARDIRREITYRLITLCEGSNLVGKDRRAVACAGKSATSGQTIEKWQRHATRNCCAIARVETSARGIRKKAVVAGLLKILKEGALEYVDLVEVDLPLVLYCVIADVAGFEGDALYALLNPEVVLLGIRRAQIGID